MKRAALFLMTLLVIGLPLSAQGLGDSFQKAKEQVKMARWTDALGTLEGLDKASQAPGFEAQRKQLEPALAFYRGVCLANLDRPAEAQAQFQTYLAANPNASLDRAMYSKKAVEALETARKTTARQGESPSGLPSLAAAYRDFRVTDAAAKESPSEKWADGPVRVLLTTEDKRDWAALSDAVSRSEYVTKFWAVRDRTPETPENEFRQEFEKRVAFADKYFTEDEVRGSLTDRGMVFLVLGPPTYAGRKPISAGEDTAESQGLSSVGRHDADIAVASLGAGTAKATSGQKAALADSMSGPGTTIREASPNWREVWHYRRELLPQGVPYQQVDFEFITRKGYGKNVLQRDSAALTTLEIAKQKMRTSSGKTS
jgi:GWxTD domain-containing protein